MPVAAPKILHSPEALTFWNNKITENWKKAFSARELSLGKEIAQNGEIRELELTPTGAIANARFDHEDCYAMIDWDDINPEIRTAAQDPLLGKSLAVAAFLEIEKLLAVTPNTQTAKIAPKDKLTSINKVAAKTQQANSRPLILRFTSNFKTIQFSAHWEQPNGSLVLALKQGKNLPDEASPQEREKLIRLTSLTRKAGFQFKPILGVYTLDNLDRILEFWKNDINNWESYFVLDLPDELLNLPIGVQEPELCVELISKKPGTLDFAWDLSIEDSVLEAEDTVRLIRAHHNPLIIPDVGLVSLSKDKTDMLLAWKRWMDLHPTGEMPRYLMFSLFKDDPINLSMAMELKTWREGLRKIPSDIPELPSFLRSYQKQGVCWLWHLCDNNCHGLLADEMGLGKTLQVLSLIATRSPHDAPDIIVCPASVVPVWEKEAKRFFPDIQIEVLKAGHDFITCTKKVLWLASYTQLRRHKFLLDRTQFGYVILDEAQQIKNPDAKVSQACMKIKAHHRIVLSGTPLENKYLDIWTLFRFLMPGLMVDRRRFEERSFQDNIQENIRKQIAPFVLRRTKSDVLKELPGKTEIECICPLTDVQAQEYARLTNEGIRQLGDDLPKAVSEQSLSFLTLLTRLRQVCCDPSLLPWMKTDLESSGKIVQLMEKLEEILANNHKTVIFSQFTTLIARVDQALKKQFPNVPVFTLTGQTKDRAEPVNDFQQTEGAAVMLVSLRAGGVGITLHSADYVFLMDPWWNPAVEDQAIDRVHRIGQDKPVFVYRMITPGTIEARIQQLKAEKKNLFTGVLGAMSDISDIKNYYKSLSDLIALLPETE